MKYSIYSKDNGILTKEMRLKNGAPFKDSTQCWMEKGTVETKEVLTLQDFHENLKNLKQNQAIGLGIAEGADEKSLRIVTKKNEGEGTISRSKDHIKFTDQPTIMLLDYDPEKGKPALSMDEVRDQLIGIMPEFADCQMLALGSTSAGVYRDGETPPDSLNGGIHFYVVVDDGTKIPETGKFIAARSWLKGYGRYAVSTSGALLARTLFDEAIYSPERLIFEAPPVLGVGLKQLPRVSKYWPGGVLKTSDVRGLSVTEEAKVEELKAVVRAATKPEADIINAAHSKSEVSRMVKSGMSKAAAKEQMAKANRGVYTGSHPVQFAGMAEPVTVTDIMRRPNTYHEWPCADLDESLDLNAAFRAMCFNNEKGVIVHSFAHGGGNSKLDKIEILLDQDNPIRVLERIEEVLRTGALPDIFDWAGVLAYIGENGAVRSLTAATAPLFIGRLVKFCRNRLIRGVWTKEPSQMTDKMWKAFLEKGNWDIPKLEGITHCPYFHDGELVKTKGFNGKTGLYLSKDFDIKVPTKASPEAAHQALVHLRGILSGFPFETAVNESVALSMMLTAVQRHTLETAPLFAVTATTPGTGKSQLATGIASIMTGSAPAVHGFRDNEQETAKMLMAALLQGSSNIIIDNVKLGVPFGGDSVCAVLSSPKYVDRELGHSRTRTVSTKALMSVTGNNLRLASDVTRRTVMIRMDAKCEQPELREFKESFTDICIKQREPILKSVLTILSAYHGAKRPKVGKQEVGYI